MEDPEGIELPSVVIAKSEAEQAAPSPSGPHDLKVSWEIDEDEQHAGDKNGGGEHRKVSKHSLYAS